MKEKNGEGNGDGGDGGDMTLYMENSSQGTVIVAPGNPGKNSDGDPGRSGDVVFFLHYGTDHPVEMLRIRHDGEFFVRGNPVATDEMVYAAFRLWLAGIRVEKEQKT